VNLAIVISAVVGFAIGAIPFGVLVSRAFFGTDLRRAGSGNIGAANALRTLGKRGAAAVLVLDALKGFAPTLAAGVWAGPIAAAAAGLGAVAGHCWSPFLGLRGGKGVATLFGSLFALWWPAGCAFTAVWIATAAASGYASLASIVAALAMVPVLWFGVGSPGLIYGIVAAVVVLVRHHENIERLRLGTENRLSLLKAKRT
jgi:glycerol-3-phosphate acyltransferase PlsY